MNLIPRLPFFGIVARVALRGDSNYGRMRLQRVILLFWRIDDWGINLQENGTSERRT